MKRILLIVAILGVVALGIIVLLNQLDREIAAPKTSQFTEVKITSSGFEPAEVTIVKGGTVRWINVDTEPHRVAANPYPTHSDLPELDSKTNIGPNSTYSFTFENSGTVAYHDHLHPTFNASVIVKG